MVEILLDHISEDIVETIHEPLLALDSDLKVILANRSFIDSFKVTREETLGSFIYDLGNRQWDIPRLRELLEKVLPENNPFDNYEVEHNFATIGRRIMLLNARQIEQAVGQEQIILLAIEDITERKETEFELSRYRQGLEKLVEEQTVDLNERVKEIGCLYAVLSLFAKPFKSIDEVLKATVFVIPRGWQYPEFCRARIVFEGREFAAEDFRETTWKQSADIVLSGETVGTVEVCYLEEMPALDEGPFLKQERNLIDELARQLAGMVQRELDLVRIEYLNSVLQSLRNINQLIVQEKRRGPLIQMICKNLAHTDDLRGAWIVLTDGLPDRVEGTQTGFNDIAFSELLNLFQRGETPACLGHGQTEPGVCNVTNDPASACRNCPLADTNGGNGAITIELKYGNHRYGYMGIALPIKFANDKEEASLFEEIAEETAHALASIEQEEAVKEAETRYRAIFEGAAEGILVADMETRRFRYCNPAICEMLGYAEEELIELDVTDIHPKESLDPLLAEFDAQALGDKLLAPSISCLRKDGSVIYADIQATSAVIDGLECNVAFFTDVTERRQMEAQFHQAQKMEAIGTLAGGVAHDFNNILTSIIGNASLALMEVDKDGPLREAIEDIKVSGERAASLTRQLLAFSRKQVVQPKILNLNELLTDIEKMIARLIGEDVELLTITKPELWPVEMDPGQMEQVIMNLAINAKDAMPKGGKLTIEVANVELDDNYFRKHGIGGKQPGFYVMLAASDTGIGMDKEIQEHIFDPFFTTKEIGKGTGLGLSTIYGIVKQNNGFIWVYSEPGQGSTFKIYLPKAKGDAEPIEKNRTPVKALGGSETILIAEDDNAARKLVRTVLKLKGYKVLESENGEDALRVGEGHDGPIDLLITDVVMPNMDGKDLADRLQPIYPQMKVIYMSGYTDNAIAHHGVLARGLNFIEKPFTPEGLARRVREVLNTE
ncbi:MAG: PAS domain S-box protein [Deltaproteobacteria bacterium]|nr:PAS domain S-box protein [Deltaproteobacteria bacterium]